MISQHEFKLFEGCLDRMVVAKWIEKYAFQVGQGMSIQWTADGWKIVRLLKRVVIRHNLKSGPEEAKRFDAMCNDVLQQRPAKDDGIRPDVASFWRSCMCCLDLDREDADFTSLAQVLEKIGPDSGPDEYP